MEQDIIRRRFGDLRDEHRFDDHAISSFPINSLLPELLAESFYWYIRRFYEARYLANPPTPYAWLAIRHVCRRWREIALHYPQLSATICLTRPESVDDMLYWSKAAPLHVYSGGDYTSNAAAVLHAHLAAFNNLSRITSANFKLTEPIIRKLFSLPRDKPTAFPLSSLDILFFHGILPDDSDVNNKRQLLPGVTFPALSCLTCAFASLSMCANLFSPSLRILHLIHLSPRVAIGELVDILRPLTQLGELQLQHTLARSPEAERKLADGVQSVGVSAGPISLPRLRTISLADYRGILAIGLLSRISLPPRTSIAVECDEFTSPDLHDAHIAVLTTNLRGRSNRTTVPEPCSLSIEINSAGRMWLRIWTRPQPVADMRSHKSSEEPSLLLALGGVGENQAFARILDVLSLSAVRSAYLSERVSSWRRFTWADVLPHLAAVEELGLGYDAWEGGDHNVSDHDDASDMLPSPFAAERDGAVLPRLKVLRLYETSHGPSDCTCNKWHVPQVNGLVHGLTERARLVPGAISILAQVEGCPSA